MTKLTNTFFQGLGSKRLAAVNQKAKKLRTTPDSYLKQIIDADLELDHLVNTHSLSDLSAPFREAFGDADDNALGELVESLRKKHSRKLSK